MAGWQDGDVALRYLRTIDVLIPRRGEILALFADLAETFTGERPHVLDLGAGAGEVTATILAKRPHAYTTLVDHSDEILAVSAARFSENPNVTVLKRDLNLGLPSDRGAQQYDLVASCFSLHHIEFGNRVGLYRDIRRALRPGGLFVNADRFKSESELLGEWEFDRFVGGMATQIRERFNTNRTFDEVKASQLESDRRQGDKPGTIWETERDLRQAGFGAVDCLWKYQNLAVLVASK
jgi:tRNA (cmo5U34)-methyltransferase